MNLNKFLFCIVLLQLIVAEFLMAQNKDSLLYLNTPFESEEVLIYRVAYGLIKGGEASLIIRAEPVGDTYLFHIKALAETTGLVGSMVKVRDMYESYVNIVTGYPVKSIRNIKEQKYNSYNEVLFFREQGFLRSLNSGDHPAPADVHDVLSAFYFARRYLFSNQLQKDEIISLNTYFDDQFFPINIKYKETEIIKTDFGKLRCLKFIPMLENNKVFKEEGQFQLWVTDDQNYIPVKIRVKLPIGSLKCDIIDFRGIKYKEGELKKD